MVRVAFLVLLVLTACRPDESLPDASMLEPGRWRATLALPAAELPFVFEVSHEAGGASVLYIINGSERIRVDEVQFFGDSVVIRMPVYDSEFRAAYSPGNLRGEWFNYEKPGRYTIPFSAERGDSPRFERKDTVPGTGKFNPSGRWDVTFSPGTDGEYKAVGVLQNEDHRLTGTFLTMTGDYRYLEGAAEGNTIKLSCFDGAHAFLFTAHERADGTLEGTFFSGSHWREPWRATRSDTVSLPDAFGLTRAQTGDSAFVLNLTGIDGTRLALHEAPYAGKPVILCLMGTWCPNCKDATAFLTELFAAYHPRGLEIVGLAYENSSNIDTVRRRVKRYIERLEVPFRIVPAGSANKRAAAATVPMLNHVLAYPTTISLDRRHRVHAIHTGFSGPATGDEYEKARAGFLSHVESILEDDAATR